MKNKTGKESEGGGKEERRAGEEREEGGERIAKDSKDFYPFL